MPVWEGQQAPTKAFVDELTRQIQVVLDQPSRGPGSEGQFALGAGARWPLHAPPTRAVTVPKGRISAWPTGNTATRCRRISRSRAGGAGC